MKNFKTNTNIIILHFIIFILLFAYTINVENRQTQMHVILLSIAIVISFIMLISSLIKKITITDDKIIIKNLFKTTVIDIPNISYGYSLSAMGRYVLIINDGTHTAMISSLMSGFNEVLELVSSKITEDDKKSFNMITSNSLKRKYIIYMLVMVFIVALLVYGILTSYHIL